MMHISTGPLRYSFDERTGYKLVVEVDPELSRYYRSLIPKYHAVNPQRYSPHISVVRREIPLNLEPWGKHEGEIVEFQYDSYIHRGTTYWWLNVFCVRLENVRLELGLPVSSEFTRPPDTFIKVFHTTLANSKSLAYL